MLFRNFFSFSLLIFVCGYDYEDIEYETNYDDEYPTDTSILPAPRVRRFPTQSSVKTLNAKEIREVKGIFYGIWGKLAVGSPNEALKQLLTNMDENSLTEDPSNIDDGIPYNTEFNTTALTRSYVRRSEPTRSSLRRYLFQRKKTTTTDATTTEETTTMPTTTTTLSTIPTAKWPIDVPALLDLIAVLAEDYESNLTKKLNESLAKMSIPTCETFTQFKQTTSEYDANATGTVISKCFVCGLEETGVPHSAPCADAFAGDFIPMVPVDPTARAQISKFRKYCKYQNIRGYKYNSTQPRAIFGRWTGGCSVRWIDLSGIYTQRTCRSRHQAIMGKHFGSKRMARLEMALMAVDNGCIVSPMATLVPLSRGISLFARFHACVCTGSWCNESVHNTPWIASIFFQSFAVCTLTLVIDSFFFNVNVKELV